MADVKQILVVDDHFEMLELLRSMLDMSGHDFEVVAVPSAEEAMLEMLRMKLDLLITDVRLPGMSGFDFVRRVRRRNPDLPVIMITAYSSAQGQKEADELGVYRYFAKPLDTDNVLTAVHNALYGETVDVTAPPPPSAASKLPDGVQRRLQSLQVDTGATGLVLSTVHGQVLLELGDNSRLDIPHIITKISENVVNSLALAELLEEDNPFTIQYHTGQATELYNANVGRDYFVTLVFGMESRRGRIGTIWVFAQRAIRDLVGLLPPLKAAGVERAPEPEETGMADLLDALNAGGTPPPAEFSQLWDRALTQQVKTADKESIVSLTTAVSQVSALATDDAGLKGLVSGAVEDASKETLEAGEPDMDGLLAALNLSPAETAVNLDEFWADALSESEADDKTGGMSFAEAMRQGLINLGEDE